MESDRFIAVREMNQQRGSQDIIIIDIQNPQQQLRFPVSADSALMHPSKQILALKGEYNFFYFSYLIINNFFFSIQFFIINSTKFVANF